MPEFPSQDRLVRKEVALGTLRDLTPPLGHIGLQVLAPFQEVASDDVIFDYASIQTDGLANARAEDAESELAQKDITYGGVARASVVDWALKDHYTASDVTRYRDTLMLQAQAGINSLTLPQTLQGDATEFRGKVDREQALRRRKLDNRIEWMIMTSLETGGIAYNDGKIKFTVDYGRPAGQTNQTRTTPTAPAWGTAASDPINDVLDIQELMFDTYGVHMTRAITSRKVLNQIVASDKFTARTGLAVAGSPATPSAPATPIDPRYLIDGWGPSAAAAVLERATGVQFIEYDSVYRTRPVGSTTVTNNRFLSQNKIFFLPAEADVSELDDAIGFGKTLTSPHPEGNWAAGFYEWEQETKDPWGMDRGTGVKAFPVFPHMELTYTMVAY